MNPENIANINERFEVNSHFYDKYNPQIRAIVTRILHYANKAQDIDDCVNIVYVELMERLRQYNETRGSMGAFVAIITRSVALDYCRSSMRKTGELIGDAQIDFLSEPIKFEDAVEFEMLVDSILEKLNEQESILFAMKYIYFYTAEEIAKTFKINRNAVDGRVNRLKKKIKKLLTKGGIII
jgi:RNA polymerase sigma-70 factor (ECF subfamily)